MNAGSIEFPVFGMTPNVVIARVRQDLRERPIEVQSPASQPDAPRTLIVGPTAGETRQFDEAGGRYISFTAYEGPQDGGIWVPRGQFHGPEVGESISDFLGVAAWSDTNRVVCRIAWNDVWALEAADALKTRLTTLFAAEHAQSGAPLAPLAPPRQRHQEHRPDQSPARQLWFAPKERPKDLPVVLFVHGGGWQHGNASWNRFVARAFASSEFAALVTSYRLAPSSRRFTPGSPKDSVYLK
jgi:alpha/beta hydrolase fold